MTIKNVYVTDNFSKTLGWCNAQDVHGGGQDIHIMMTYELTEIIEWWRTWGPVFSNPNPTVTDALQQAKVLHDVSRT